RSLRTGLRSRDADARDQLPRILDALARWAGELPHFHQAQEVGHGRLAATVLVGTIWVQYIAAASRVGLDQRQGQIVAAEKPCERPGCMRTPGEITVGAPSGEARGEGGGGFHGLLIEGRR